MSRPPSIMLKNLPKMPLGISLLCSIMLTVITAVSYVYTHNWGEPHHVGSTVKSVFLLACVLDMSKIPLYG